MKTTKTLALLLLSLCAVSCVSVSGINSKVVKYASGYDGTCTTVTDTVPDFNSIEVSGGVRLSYTQGAGPHVAECVLSDSIASSAEIYVRDGTLHLGVEGKRNLSDYRFDVSVSSSSLERLSAEGMALVTLENGLETGNCLIQTDGFLDISGGGIKCDTLVLDVSGSCNVSLKDVSAGGVRMTIDGAGNVGVDSLRAGTTVIEADGAADVKISGFSDRARFNLDGMGKFKCGDFKVRLAEASCDGYGKMRLWVTDSLKADVGGIGGIRYKGSPVVESKSKHVRRMKHTGRDGGKKNRKSSAEL